LSDVGRRRRARAIVAQADGPGVSDKGPGRGSFLSDCDRCQTFFSAEFLNGPVRELAGIGDNDPDPKQYSGFRQGLPVELQFNRAEIAKRIPLYVFFLSRWRRAM